jgi:spermidine synthase
LLSADGSIGIQSTSPYHAKDSFIAIGNTLSAANFKHVQQYHDNVPSFGEWGWTIATKQGLSPYERLSSLSTLKNQHGWLTLDMILSAFNFPQGFYADKASVGINYLGSHTIYQLHQQAWRDQQGITN